MTCSKVSAFPPTIIVSLPCSSVLMLPETGESTMSAPLARTLATVSRLTTGLTVLMSMMVLPALRPAMKPSGPSATPSSAAESVTITKITSAPCATSRGVAPHFIPLSSSHCAFDFVRL